MMRILQKYVLVVWVIGLLTSPPVVAMAVTNETVGKWERYVISLYNSSYSGNPFELDVEAVFKHVTSGMAITVPGYYAGNNTWKIAFMPNLVGMWVYSTRSSDPELDGMLAQVLCIESGRPGLLAADAVARKKWKFADGPYVVPIALRLDLFQEDAPIERVVAAADFIKADVGAHMFEFTMRNEVYSDWKNRKFDLALWDRLEARLDALAERGLGVHIMFYSDDSQEPLWGPKTDAEELLLRYAVARLAAYPVVIFNTGIDISEYRDQAWVDWFGEQIQSLDPYGHPVSSRHGGGSGELVMMGQTFDSRGERTAKIEDMSSYFNESIVPVSMDDAWSENSADAARRNKDFRPADIRRAVWKCVMAGGVGVVLRGSHSHNEDTWFRLSGTGELLEADLESEQYLRLVNLFVARKFGKTFGSMVPTPSLVADGYALADPERSNILYFRVGNEDRYDSKRGAATNILMRWYYSLQAVFGWEEDRIGLNLADLHGHFNALWFDPRSGKESAIGRLVGGKIYRLKTPNPNDWLLLLTRTDSK